MITLGHVIQLATGLLLGTVAVTLAVRLAREVAPGLEQLIANLGPALARLGALATTARRKLTPRRFRR